MGSGMRETLRRHGTSAGVPAGVRGRFVLGVAVVGSVLVLAALAGRRRASARHAQVEPEDTHWLDDDAAIPLLEDAVTLEELRRAPIEPPVLTDVVVPGRPRR